MEQIKKLRPAIVSDWLRMMNKVKEYGIRYALLALLVICFGLMIGSSMKSGQGNSVYMLYHSEAPLDGKSALERQEQNKEEEKSLNLTLWGSQKKQTVKYEEFAREASADVITICGASRLLFPQQVSLEAGDYEGCLISEDIAYELFGNKNIKDYPIVWDGKDYQVRGVLKDLTKTVVLQAGKETKEILTATALQVPEGKENETLKTYEGRYGNESIIKLTTFAGWGKNLIGILIWILGGMIFIPAVKKGIGLRRKPAWCAVWFAGIAAAVFAYWWIGRAYLMIPLGETPANWSDFGFFKEAFKTWKESLQNIMTIEKNAPERIYINNLTDTLKYMAGVIILFMAGFKRWKNETLKEVYICCIVSIGAAFTAVMLAGNIGSSLAGSICLWWLMPIYFTLRYLTLKIDIKRDTP